MCVCVCVPIHDRALCPTKSTECVLESLMDCGRSLNACHCHCSVCRPHTLPLRVPFSTLTRLLTSLARVSPSRPGSSQRGSERREEAPRVRRSCQIRNPQAARHEVSTQDTCVSSEASAVLAPHDLELRSGARKTLHDGGGVILGHRRGEVRQHKLA